MRPIARIDIVRAAVAAKKLGSTRIHESLGCVGMWRDFPDKLSALTGCAAFA
jgi:hypothetical protein